MVTVIVVATLTSLWVDLCLAHYSLSISEENLHSYFSNSDHSQLVQGKFVRVVDDGDVVVDDSGTLLLSDVPMQSGSGGSGSGYNLGPGEDMWAMSKDSVFPSSGPALPPLPAHGDTVDFTWVATATVDYVLHATQEGGQLFNPLFNILQRGIIPLGPSDFQLRVSCLPLAVEVGRVHVNLTTITDRSRSCISFFLEKSCNDTNRPSLSTLFLQTSVTHQDLISSQILPFSIPVLLTSMSPLPDPSPTATYSHPLLPTALLSTPGSVTLSSSLPSYMMLPLSSFLPPLIPLTTLASLHRSLLLTTVEPSFSYSNLELSTLSVSPYPSTMSLSAPSLVESSSSLISTFVYSPSSPSLLTFVPILSFSTATLQVSRATSFSHSLSLSVNPSISSFVVDPTPYPAQSPSVSIPLSLSSSTNPNSVKDITTISDFVGSSDDVSSGIRHSVAELSSSVVTTTIGKGDSSSQLLIVVCAPVGGILLASIVFLLCVILCIKFKTTKKKATRAFSDDPLDVVDTVPYSTSPVNDYHKKALPPLSLWMSLPWGIVPSLPRSLQTLVTRLGVDRKSLSIIDTISRGEYGSVVSGQLNSVRTDVMSGSQSVTIKMLTGFPEGSRRDEVVRFLEASTLMKGVKHQYILPVLRVSVEDNYIPLVIYPMVEHGDMHRVIKLASDPEHSILPPLTTVLSLELAIQIATAMSYLAEHSIVHPDLALRNCALDSACTVKVSDGALAQQFYPECYYTLFGATRPVRWAAVETLQEGLCTVRSNVWSYAVAVWEIFTFAEMPYSEVNNNRSILSTIKMGARLPQPDTCPQALYETLCSCWSERGEERPSFKMLISGFQKLMSKLSNQKQIQSSLHGQQRYSSGSMGTAVSRERLSHGGDSPRSRSLLTRREASQGSLRRISMASMMSRGSTADKLSVTFSVLSGDDNNMPSGSDSDDEVNHSDCLELKTFTDQQELQSMLHQVSTSFVESSIEKIQLAIESKDDVNSSIHTTTLSDVSSHTLVPPSLSSPVRSPKVAADDTSLASSNPVSLTPPPNHSADTQSKTSTMDLESVSTAPYTSSPLHSTAFLYPTTPGSGFGVVSSSERGDQSPLIVGHRARSSHSPALLPCQPSAKSTDSGIRSDEDTEATHSPSTSKPLTEAVETNGLNMGAAGEQGISDFSTSLMSAFDTWDTT